MGLSGTASRRRPHVLVMAPALTETGQTQSFTTFTGSPLNLFDPCDINFKAKPIGKEYRKLLTVDELKGLNGTTATKRCNPLRPLDVVSSAGDLSMNGTASMGDHPDTMGLHKSSAMCPIPDGQENHPMVKVNDMVEEIPPNEEELMMQVISNFPSGIPFLTESDMNCFLSPEDVITEISKDTATETAEVPSESVSESADDLWKRRLVLERQQSRLLRRLKTLEARAVSKHAACEVKSVLEHACRLARTEDAGDTSNTTTPDSTELTTFVDKMRSTLYTSQQQMRFRTGARYFGSGSVDPPPLPETSVWHSRLSSTDREAMKSVCGQLSFKLKESRSRTQFDSDATESSSGGDSCDETDNNPLLPDSSHSNVKKSDYTWKWLRDRGAIASRWTWLTAKITDLDFRIKTLSDCTRRLRFSKGSVTLEDESVSVPAPHSVNGYHGTLPGAVKTQDTGPNGTLPANFEHAGPSTSARTRPLQTRDFKKRHLLRTEALSSRGPSKISQPATVRCWCTPGQELCLVCGGRPEPTQPANYPPVVNPPLEERIAALDPSYHPAISLKNEVPLSLHLDSVMRMHEWQSRRINTNIPRKYNKYKFFNKDINAIDRLKKEKHKRKMHKHTTALLSAKLLEKKLERKEKRRKERILNRAPIPPIKIIKAKKSGDSDDESDIYVTAPMVIDSGRASPVSHASSTTGDDCRKPQRLSRGAEDSYDINNIVIPFSMAASIETIPYKEIPTPKWRLCSEITEWPAVASDDEVEDVSTEAVTERHARSEDAERRRFMSYIKLPFGVRTGRSGRRTDSRADSSGANTPDAMSPMPSDQMDLSTPPATPHPPDESVPLRRRTLSSCRVKFDHERAASPDDDVEVPAYEPRIYPLSDSALRKMEAMMPQGFAVHGAPPTISTASPAPRKPPNGAIRPTNGAPLRHAFNSARSVDSPSSSETVSAMDEVEEEDDEEDEAEDPDDPDWNDDVDEDFQPGM